MIKWWGHGCIKMWLPSALPRLKGRLMMDCLKTEHVQKLLRSFIEISVTGVVWAPITQGAELKTVSHQIIGLTPECWQPGGLQTSPLGSAALPRKAG